MGLEPFTTVAIGTAAANVALPFAKKVLEGIGEKHAADWLENQAGALGVKLMSGVQGLAYYPRVFLFDLPKVKLAESESGSADKLKRLLETGPRALPKRVTIKGNVMPGSLLQFGWWERKNKALLDKGIAWQSDRPIQRWLFSGFEQWA
ncbi:MAG TPA: hypothetical protein VLK25_13435, partial [Allosphingosinicella sp.]|nr:hypothetical protein [Allosphingosinicella sp.]